MPTHKPDWLFCNIDPRDNISPLSITVANHMYPQLIVVPKTGILRDLAIFCSSSAGGNVAVAVYDDEGILLWSSGSVACPATGAWRVVADPQLAVTEGDELYLAFAASSTSPTFYNRTIGNSAFADLPIHGSQKLSFDVASAFPPPASFSLAGAASTRFYGIVGWIE